MAFAHTIRVFRKIILAGLLNLFQKRHKEKACDNDSRIQLIIYERSSFAQRFEFAEKNLTVSINENYTTLNCYFISKIALKIAELNCLDELK